MANSNAPFGLRPVRMFNGSPWNGKVKPYYVPSTYATALYIGDPVVITGTGNASEFRGFEPGQLSEVNLGAAGDATAITGVLWGVEPVTHLSQRYKPASTEALLFVIDDPDVVFEIQDDGSGTVTADAFVGLNTNLVSGSGVAATGLSGWTLDASTPAADASNQLIILNASRRRGNELADFAVWDVLINQHTYKPASGLGIA